MADGECAGNRGGIFLLSASWFAPDRGPVPPRRSDVPLLRATARLEPYALRTGRIRMRATGIPLGTHTPDVCPRETASLLEKQQGSYEA